MACGPAAGPSAVREPVRLGRKRSEIRPSSPSPDRRETTGNGAASSRDWPPLSSLRVLLKDARRAATAALTLEDKLTGQKQVKALEAHRNTKRRALFDAQDEIDAQRERLIAEIEGKLQQRTSLSELFAVRWSLT